MVFMLATLLGRAGFTGILQLAGSSGFPILVDPRSEPRRGRTRTDADTGYRLLGCWASAVAKLEVVDEPRCRPRPSAFVRGRFQVLLRSRFPGVPGPIHQSHGLRAFPILVDPRRERRRGRTRTDADTGYRMLGCWASAVAKLEVVDEPCCRPRPSAFVRGRFQVLLRSRFPGSRVRYISPTVFGHSRSRLIPGANHAADGRGRTRTQAIGCWAVGPRRWRSSKSLMSLVAVRGRPRSSAADLKAWSGRGSPPGAMVHEIAFHIAGRSAGTPNHRSNASAPCSTSIECPSHAGCPRAAADLDHAVPPGR